jgi:hypothetical protein
MGNTLSDESLLPSWNAANFKHGGFTSKLGLRESKVAPFLGELS